ncbi:hypothetical protein ISN45_At02g040770 [Arabidopsis thaliana x Arabidopsis arenosa]|uniref:Uncharacterized protein n=2 Tax=Arabidopsis TaxID=3701 RepID=A0A8T2G8V0_ARASU|nr:hypothetical protein ISN45_At02g040770 [Arabidopsis thaliana x Arabidopsis arenosa]KAG7644389.1 hypothetical protein ISN44_As02g040890 [Arabidopsis suecica]
MLRSMTPWDSEVIEDVSHTTCLDLTTWLVLCIDQRTSGCSIDLNRRFCWLL